MRHGAIPLVAAMLLMQGCGRPAGQNQATSNELGAPVAPSNTTQAADTQNRVPLDERDGPIDSTSAEAAGQVVQSYGALIEQGRWTEAKALWGDQAAAARMQSELTKFAEVHLEIGSPSDPEGAAGSIYVTMPVIFYGDGQDGQPFRRSADVTLRRVNDVPGSTDAQRRWHIERIDWVG